MASSVLGPDVVHKSLVLSAISAVAYAEDARSKQLKNLRMTET